MRKEVQLVLPWLTVAAVLLACEIRWVGPGSDSGGSGGGGGWGGGGGGGTEYSVGGNVSGLSTGALRLQLNGGTPYEVRVNGPFTMPGRLPGGAGYAVSVESAPFGFATTVVNSSGTISGNVTNVVITVAANRFSVGGTVTGLKGTLVLDNALIEQIAITSNGPFTFPTKIAAGSPYNVTLWNSPAAQICRITNGEGSAAGDVTNVVVTCSDKYYVKGSITGVTAPITLQNNGGDDVTVSADTAFTFPAPLADGAAYAVTVKPGSAPDLRCTIANGSGTIRGADVTNVSAACTPKAWSSPATFAENLSPDGGAPDDARVALDPSGNAIVVWQQSDGARMAVFKSERRAGTWTLPASLTDNISPDGQDAAAPDVAFAGNGEAIVVWQQSDGANEQVFKSELRAGAWTHPASLFDSISPVGRPARLPRVAMAANGDAIVVWQQGDGARQRIYKSERRGGVWTHPASLADAISPAVGGDATQPVVAMAESGGAVIAWLHDDGTAVQRVLRSEHRGGAWTHPAALTAAVNPPGSAAGVRVALNATGAVALIVWQQAGGANQQVFKSELRSGAWTNPTGPTDNVSPDGQDAIAPDVAVDETGNAVIVWTQSDDTRLRVFKSEHRAGAWTHPLSLADNFGPVSAAAAALHLAMAAGKTIVVWPQVGPTHQEIFRSEHRGFWLHPANLADNLSPTAGAADRPRVAIARNGDALVVWSQLDATGALRAVFASEYR
jgi:hypothetical protein